MPIGLTAIKPVTLPDFSRQYFSSLPQSLVHGSEIGCILYITDIGIGQDIFAIAFLL